MPVSKKKSDISLNTLKTIVITSKYRKGSKNVSLSTGKPVNEQNGIEIMDEDAVVQTPTKAVPITSKLVKIITFEVYKLYNLPFDGIICKNDVGSSSKL